jgi:hypothetical protein
MSIPNGELFIKLPTFGNYSRSEADEAMIASLRAMKECRTNIEAFNECRKMPIGKFVEPERCLEHANAIIQCFYDMRKVPKVCEGVYSELMQCLRDPKAQCENKMEDYLNCIPSNTNILDEKTQDLQDKN